jgi:hypothetical protein
MRSISVALFVAGTWGCSHGVVKEAGGFHMTDHRYRIGSMDGGEWRLFASGESGDPDFYFSRKDDNGWVSVNKFDQRRGEEVLTVLEVLKKRFGEILVDGLQLSRVPDVSTLHCNLVGAPRALEVAGGDGAEALVACSDLRLYVALARHDDRLVLVIAGGRSEHFDAVGADAQTLAMSIKFD